MKQRLATTLTLTLLLLLGLVGQAAAQRTFDHEEVVERTFEARPGQMLTLRSDLGSVSISGGAGRTIVVRVLKGADRVGRDRAQELFDRFTLDFDQTGKGLTIDGDYDRPGSRWRRNDLQVHYEIRVPEALDVSVRTGGGSIAVEDLRGTALLNTSGGSISIRDVGGEVEVQTSGGSITAERVGGRAKLHTSGGSVKAFEVGGPVEDSHVRW